MTDKTKNLLIRTASGIVLLAIVLAALLINYATYCALALVIMLGCTIEFYKLARKAGAKPMIILGCFASVLILAANLLLIWGVTRGWHWDLSVGIPIIIGLFVIFTIVEIFATELVSHSQNPMLDIGTTLTAPLYTAVPVSLMSLLPMVSDIAGSWNPLIILAYIFMVWANDIFAYLFGITLGKHKMCPRISPKKSWEGFAGGVLAATAFGAFAGWYLGGNIWLWGGVGLAVALSGVAGDLTESMFKRSVDVKDSGHIMPGHGGFLDRFDAMLLSAPVAFIIFTIYSLLR